MSHHGATDPTFGALGTTNRTSVRAYLRLSATAVLVLLIARFLGWGGQEIISAISSSFIGLYVRVSLAPLRLLPRRSDRTVGLLALVVLLAMASFYAEATALTAGLLMKGFLSADHPDSVSCGLPLSVD